MPLQVKKLCTANDPERGRPRTSMDTTLAGSECFASLLVGSSFRSKLAVSDDNDGTSAAGTTILSLVFLCCALPAVDDTILATRTDTTIHNKPVARRRIIVMVMVMGSYALMACIMVGGPWTRGTRATAVLICPCELLREKAQPRSASAKTPYIFLIRTRADSYISYIVALIAGSWWKAFLLHE